MLPIDQVGELLSMIEDEKKISFDKEYAEELYRQYNERKSVDDTAVINELENEFSQKMVLLVAPGKSVGDYIEKINELSDKENIVTIGLNSTLNLKYDYMLTTRLDIYVQAVADGKSIIVPSNVSKGGRGSVKVLNYANWIEIDDRTHDSSAVIALKLLWRCGVKKILLAGFDGFSININENYYDPNLRNPVNYEQAERRNKYYKNLIKKYTDMGIEFVFVTPSLYQ